MEATESELDFFLAGIGFGIGIGCCKSSGIKVNWNWNGHRVGGIGFRTRCLKRIRNRNYLCGINLRSGTGNTSL